MPIFELHPDNPQKRFIAQAVETLRKGGIIIYPTDSVYAIGCDIEQQKAVDRIAKIKKIDPAKAMFSLVCSDISQIALYTKQVDNQQFKILKSHLPGAFTFIMNAGSKIPKQFRNKKKTLGLRIPNDQIALEIVEELGRPLMSTSLPYEEGEDIPLLDINEIIDLYEKRVDHILYGTTVPGDPSTVVDLTQNEPEVIREGSVPFEW